jgi:hypothetical protein
MRLLSSKPITSGFILFAVLTVAYSFVVALARTGPSVVIWTPYVAAFLGAGITGYYARSRLFVHLAILAVAMATWIGVLNLAFSGLELPTDFPGMRGSLMVAGLSLPFVILLSFAGGAIGN